MAFDKETRTITMYQGDYEEFFLSGFDKDKKYRVYMAIQDRKRQPIGNEIEKETDETGVLKFEIVPSLSKLFTVPPSKESEEYYFAFKAFEIGTQKEKTIRLNGQEIGSKNTIIVYPQEAKGYLGV